MRVLYVGSNIEANYLRDSLQGKAEFDSTNNIDVAIRMMKESNYRLVIYDLWQIDKKDIVMIRSKSPHSRLIRADRGRDDDHSLFDNIIDGNKFFTIKLGNLEKLL